MESVIDKGTFTCALDVLGKKSLRISIKSIFDFLHDDLRRIAITDELIDSIYYAKRIHRVCGSCTVFGAKNLTTALQELEFCLSRNLLDHVPQMAQNAQTLAEMSEKEMYHQMGGITHFVSGYEH